MRRALRCGSRRAFASTALLLVPVLAAAQNRDAAGAPLRPMPGSWLHAWSPLVPIADLPAHGADAAALLPAAWFRDGRARATGVGAFWLSGSPAFLARELPGRWNDVRAEGSRLDGTLRRPLDAGRVGGTVVTGIAWQPVGDRAAAIGRVLLEREALRGGGTYTSLSLPYSGSPLVPIDTTTPDLARNRAVLEGAMGWRLGAWGVGASVGYDTRAGNAELAGVPRSGRVATSAIALGGGRALGPVRVAAHARLQGSAETLGLSQGSALPIIYQLEGYSEAEPRDPGGQGYRRRIERRAHAVGLSSAGAALGAAWVVFAERTRLREAQSSALVDDPPTDRWDADGWAWGAALGRAWRDSALRAAVHLRGTSAAGDARRFDLNDVIFRGDDSAIAASAELHVAPTRSAWSGAITAATRRESRLRRDGLARLSTNVTAWVPGGAVDVARTVGERMAVRAGYALATYAPVSAIPGGDSLGVVFQRWIAPAIEYESTPKLSQAVRIVTTWRTAPATLWVGAQYFVLSVTGSPTPTPFRPLGTRAGTRVTVGVVFD